MKKIVPIFMACLVFCSVGGATASAAVPPDNSGIVSPCYLYTDRASSYLTISGGVAIPLFPISVSSISLGLFLTLCSG